MPMNDIPRLDRRKGLGEAHHIRREVAVDVAAAMLGQGILHTDHPVVAARKERRTSLIDRLVVARRRTTEASQVEGHSHHTAAAPRARGASTAAVPAALPVGGRAPEVVLLGNHRKMVEEHSPHTHQQQVAVAIAAVVVAVAAGNLRGPCMAAVGMAVHWQLEVDLSSQKRRQDHSNRSFPTVLPQCCGKEMKQNPWLQAGVLAQSPAPSSAGAPTSLPGWCKTSHPR